MKIIVTSDSHGSEDRLRKLIENNKNADMLIHLGDGEKEFFKLNNEFPNLNMIITKGNCDIDKKNLLPTTKLITINNSIKILACHGHTFNVKENLSMLTEHGQNIAANIVLFGHTHKRFIQTINNITFINPGSLSLPRSLSASFAIISILNNNFDAHIIDFD